MYNMSNYDYSKYYYVKDMLSPHLISTLDSINHNYGKVVDDDGYRRLKSLGNNDKYIEYRTNRSDFRSQHFENFKPSDLNILFAGCSWTYGDGLPEEYIWRSILTDKIKEKFPNQNVEQYSLGVSGASISLICKNVLAFLRKYPDVDYLYILLPGFDRSTALEEVEKNKYYRMSRVYYTSPDNPSFINKKAVKHFTKYYSPVDSVYHNFILLQAVIDICELRGIKLFFGTWIKFDKEIYEYEGFNGYVDIPEWLEMENTFQTSDPTMRSVASDGCHPGIDHMAVIANTFYKATFNEEE